MYFMILLMLVCGYVVWKILRDEDNPLDKLPGPPRKPIIGCVFEFLNLTPRLLFVKMRQYAKEYGDRYVVKIIKRRILHIYSVKDVEIVLSHSKNIKKSKPYRFLEPWLGTGLLLSTGTKWHNRRKILTSTFHFNILKSFTIVMEERSRALVEKLKKEDGATVSLLPVISDFTLFTICETAMGTQLDKDKFTASIQYKNAIIEISALLITRRKTVWLHNEFLFRTLPIGRKFEKYLHIVHSFADNVIMERKKSWRPNEGVFNNEFSHKSKKRLAMLDLLLEVENNGEIDLEGIREEVNTFMFELSFTTPRGNKDEVPCHTETAMGTQLDNDKFTASIQYKNAILGIGTLLLTRLITVWLHNEFLFRTLPIGRKFEKYLHIVHSFADNVIMERKKSWKPGEGNFNKEFLYKSKKRLAMLDLLLEAENNGEIDLEGIREEVNTFMFEGHDTSAMAIVFSLMLIADHEEIQERVYEEVQNILGDSDRTLTMSDLADMKYLEAVIKETLRLYPSVPFIAREITEDFMLDDLPVKKGVEVAVHIFDLHRRPELYPDPEEFKPERFFNGEIPHPYAFVPFSAGPRNCIGQRFAMLEMKSVLSHICHNFKLYPHTKGARPELLADLLLRPAEPIFVKFVRR